MSERVPDSGERDRAIREAISLAAYDPAWPGAFAAERGRLLDLFPNRWLAVEHFGSTAVPGMPAKPIIDILGGVGSMAEADSMFEPILAAGYTTSREFNATLPDRRWFMRASHGKRTHHLHLVEFGAKQWRERLLFRDRLRADAGLADRYAELKLALARQHRDDREAYTEAKSEFVASVVQP